MKWSFLLMTVAGFVFPPASWCQPASFDDEFSSNTLDPAWMLVLDVEPSR